MVVLSEILEESTSSLSTLDHRYDVFLSFRGFNTRSSFTDHLYNTLGNANITTFLDDEEIETGVPLKLELASAIKASRASIIVLSKNYASSTWCLDELVLILEQQLRSPNYFVIPIFYHVEPTDVRKQQNSFGEAMAKHKQRMEAEAEADAEKRSIGRTCAQHYNGLLDLQKQICGDISKPNSVQVRDDVSVYTSKIAKALAHKKVFVVLDDVGSLEHLEALLGNKGFHLGSKVVITTQDASLTEKYLLNLVVQHKHTKLLLGGLYHDESLNLLSFSAFNCNNSKEGYEDVSNMFVGYSKGHPLALEVLGKALRNKDVAQWEDYIERLLKKGPLSDIKKVFQMSLESLEEDEKELFKHIACFFVGKDRESTEIILKACEFHTVSGIKNLVDRSLLSIGWDNTLMMHQLIQETGRDMVRQESPNRPEKRSRLWCHEESFKVLKQKKGKGNVQGLVLDMRMLEEDKLYELETDALSKMGNLKQLQLNYLENLSDLDMSYSRQKSFDMSYGDTQRQRVLNLKRLL
ncbi:hypothetical protein OSB04_013393 [Centaurea solstitialis]|uniref:TIR domain-containing protein n=1 Tax=Centaurea solstitialis TaxID=347529 RepID=A0AA38TD76_9ASTR|nr:hypothetical protein OSB04_013393 [Centaurea solstitialis]